MENKYEKKDVYQNVTDKIIEALEKNEANPEKFSLPWVDVSFNTPVNISSLKFYRGVNILHLWAVQKNKGYKTGYWATFKQWNELGASIKKGEKSTTAVFWKPVKGKEEECEDEKVKSFIIARGYSIFNLDQVDGYTLPEKLAPVVLTQDQKNEKLDNFFSKINFDLEDDNGKACYYSLKDKICLPKFENFRDPYLYYASLSHELIHWTGNKNRLDRLDSKKFGSQSYAFEELVAEIGAAFLCVKLGIETSVRKEHVIYLKSWLQLLKEDNRTIFSAASKAQQAVNYICELVEKKETELPLAA